MNKYELLDYKKDNSEIFAINDMTSFDKVMITNSSTYKSSKFYKTMFIILLFATIVFQVVIYLYVSSLVNNIKKLNLNNINISKSENYLNKTENIIDFICENYVKC